jgi:hypothetical protein
VIDEAVGELGDREDVDQVEEQLDRVDPLALLVVRPSKGPLAAGVGIVGGLRAVAWPGTGPRQMRYTCTFNASGTRPRVDTVPSMAAWYRVTFRNRHRVRRLPYRATAMPPPLESGSHPMGYTG